MKPDPNAKQVTESALYAMVTGTCLDTLQAIGDPAMEQLDLLPLSEGQKAVVLSMMTHAVVGFASTIRHMANEGYDFSVLNGLSMQGWDRLMRQHNTGRVLGSIRTGVPQ